MVDALKQPIVGRKVLYEYDRQNDRYVPVMKESTQQLTVGGFLAAGLLALGVAAVGQRAIRTGTVGFEEGAEETEYRSDDDPDKLKWLRADQIANLKVGRTEYEYENSATGAVAWLRADQIGNLKVGWRATGRTRTVGGWTATGRTRQGRSRINIRSRDSIADYQPLLKP